MKIITGKVTNAVLQNIDNQTITMVAIETSKNQSLTFPMDTTYTPYIQLGQSMQFALEIHPIVSEIHEPSAGTLEGTFQELPLQDLKSLYGLEEKKETADYSFVEPSIDTNFESLRFEEYQRSQKESTDSKGAYPTPEKEAKEVQKEEKTEDKSKEKEMNDTPNIDKKENEPTKIVSPLANNIEFIEEKEEKQPKATDNAFMENNVPLPEVKDEEFEEEDEE